MTDQPQPPAAKFRFHQVLKFDQSDLATKLADIHLLIIEPDDGAVARIPAHKFVLCADSDEFKKMFCGELEENGDGDVEIFGASEAVFKEFFQFFYQSDVELSTELVCNVLDLGNRFNVEKCIEACVKFLTDKLTDETACFVLSLAIFYKQNELTKACEKRIVLNTGEIFKTAGFLDCNNVFFLILNKNKKKKFQRLLILQ